MKFFLSGEIDTKIADTFRRIRKEIEANHLEEDILNLFCIKKDEIDSLKK